MEQQNMNAAPRETANAPAAPEMPAELLRQMAEIRAMDPEVKDLGTILRSEAGPRFREYVGKGLDFVDAYTLAARDRLQTLRDRRTEAAVRASTAGKRHLAATSARGEGSVNVPAEELEMIRKLNPGVSDGEIRRYYNADLKRRANEGRRPFDVRMR